MSRYALQTAMRDAAATFLREYAASAEMTLQVYRARPRSISPPTGFVDSLSEVISYTALNQRQPRATVVVIFDYFDSGTAADQRDAFVDGLVDWTLDRVHQAGANTTVAIVAIEDDPSYVPEWIPPDKQSTYYATVITLEGLALTG